MKIQRFLSFMLAIAMVFGSVSPAGEGFLKPTKASAEEISNNSAIVSMSCDNGKIMDTAEGKELTTEIVITIGETFTFTVVPDDGYKVTSVLCGEEHLAPDENGVYSVNVTGAVQIHAVCAEKEAPVFAVSVIPEGPAQQKRFQIQISACDAEIVTTAFSLEEYSTVEALGTAIVRGDAFLHTDDTVIAENGTYFVYLIDLDGRMSAKQVVVDGIDHAAPSAAQVTRTAEGWQKQVEYTVVVTDTEDIVKVTVTAPGEAEAELDEISPGQYAFTAVANGDYLVCVYDAAGNAATTSVSEMRIDGEAPTVKASRSDSGWASQVSYTYTAEDAGSGVELLYVTVGDRTTTVFFDPEDTYILTLKANQTAYVKAVDYAGNAYTLEIAETQIDTEAPVISAPARNGDSWCQQAEYSFTVADAGSGVVRVLLITPNGEEELAAGSDGCYRFTLDQNMAFRIRATDLLGHSSEVDGSENRVDSKAPAAPEFTRTADGWCAGAEYSFVPTDDLSGIASVAVQFGGADVAVTATDGVYSFVAEAAGIYQIRIVDAAGNECHCNITESMVDTGMPEISATRTTDGWATKSLYVYFVTDKTSGIQEIMLTVNGETTKVSPNETGIYSLTVKENCTVQIRAMDLAGNESLFTFNEAQIDVLYPTVSEPERCDTGWKTETAYTFRASDEHSGIAKVLLVDEQGNTVELVPDADGVYTVTIKQNGTYEIRAIDNLDHQAVITFEECQIDLIAPLIHEVARQQDGWVQTVSYLIRAEDTQSGIRSVIVEDSGKEYELTLVDGCYRLELAQNGIYQITITDNVGHKVYYTVEETKIDTAAPVIADISREGSGWLQSVAYTFNVADDLSGIALVSVAANGMTYELTPDAEGLYRITISQNQTFTVTVKDAAGNVITQDITETKADPNKPSVSNLNRDTSGWNTSAIYSFEASDDLSGIADVTVQFGSGEAETLSAGTDGLYSFTMIENDTYRIIVTDVAGNVFSVTGEETRIDTASPVIADVTRNSDTWEYAVEYIIHATDDLSGIADIKVTNSQGITITVTDMGNGTFIFPATANDTFTITVTDFAGNTDAETVVETLLDQTSPVVSDVSREELSWSQSAYYSFRAADTDSGIHSIRVLNGETEVVYVLIGDTYRFLVRDNGVYTVVVTDMVGNTTTVNVHESKIDVTAPIITEVSPQEKWAAQDNIVTIIATDESELSEVRVWDANGKEYAVTHLDNDAFQVVVDHNGDYTAEAVDVAGNRTTVQFVVCHIDTEQPDAPTLFSSGNEKWVNTDVTVTAQSADSQSGVVAYWYCDQDIPFDPALWTQADFAEGTGSVVFTQEQNTVYYVVAMDAVGRVSEKTAVRVAIDKTAPAEHELRYLEEAGSGYLRTVDGKMIYNDTLAFFMSATDAASGVIAYEFQVVTDQIRYPWTKLDGTADGAATNVQFPDAEAVIYFRVYDEAGNCSEPYTVMQGENPQTVILENTPVEEQDKAPAPTLQAMAGETEYTGNWTNSNITITVSGSDAVSGIEYYEYMILPEGRVADTEWEKVSRQAKGFVLELAEDENSTVVFRAVTYAGNRSQESAIRVFIQKTAPAVVTITPEAPTGTNGWYTQLPEYTVTYPEMDPLQAGVEYEFFCAYTSHDNGESSLPGFDWAITSTGDVPPQITGDGIFKIYAVSTDEAGNTAVSDIAVFKVDTKAPDNLSVILNGTQDILQAADSKAWFDHVNYLDKILLADFSIFLNAPASITVLADGGNSGLAALYYQISEDNTYDLTGKWTPLNSILQLQPNSKNCLFFKAMDNAGNITYFSAASIILDSLVPGGTDPFSDISMVPTEENLSAHGYYFNDVTFRIHVEEPVEDNVFSGIHSIQYRVLSNGYTTQTGTLPLNQSNITLSEGRVLSWDGLLEIDALTNNGNNVVLELTVRDQSGNTRVSRSAPVSIDIWDPQIRAEYSQNIPADIRNDTSYFTGSRTLTVTVTEQNFVPAESFIRVLNTDTNKTMEYGWVNVGDTHTAVFDIHEDGHYTVTAVITDAAGNVSSNIIFAEGTAAGSKFVIDNTSPKITVRYSNDECLGIYFNAPRIMTITVTERNFDPAKVNALLQMVSEDGKTELLPILDWITVGNTHMAHIAMNRDGAYTVNVSCADIPGNESLPTVYEGVATQHWVLDQKIQAPVVSGIADGCAYAGEVIPVITAEDVNIHNFSVKLYRTRMGEIQKDVTKELLHGHAGAETYETKKVWTLDLFPNTADYDGIYTVETTVTDKAGNTATTVITFSVNRFGSTYRYGEELMVINGTVIYRLEKDLTITEINPTKLLSGSAVIRITKDGTPISNPIYTIASTADGTEGPASHGWYEYQYVISQENFREDGIYTVILSSKDTAGNVPENTAEEHMIRFAVDTASPKLSSVIGLEDPIVKADTLTIRFKAMDNIALDSIQIYVNGRMKQQWTDLNGYELDESYVIQEGLDQHIRIVITDKAGNILDTDAADFMPGFAWQNVTVSSNMWIRYYANKPLFFGSLTGTASGAAALIWLLRKKKRTGK